MLLRMGASEEDSDDEFYDAERSDSVQDSPTSGSGSTRTGGGADAAPTESLFPWKEELEVFVRGGVPMALRGEDAGDAVTLLQSLAGSTKGLQAWRDSQGLASKLYSFKQDPESMLVETNKTRRMVDSQTNGDLSHSESGSTNADEVLISLAGDADTDARLSFPDLQEQTKPVLHDHLHVLFGL
ncbi:hypothetical protein V6N11_055473 [Hibiscus sabdariffa]|uniref:Uncharacterized protein n=1 Tax=Hibiscus sabdariffa TaxID=183260 RepID=A0ABR2PFD4_9ROSI